MKFKTQHLATAAIAFAATLAALAGLMGLAFYNDILGLASR